ncbi:MAG TPA: DUF1345 domain-containing protein [Microbacteriaceae bacterium]|nr:DUF1345 domain-containing protein [Microbacteriaceae bacterium]HRA09598.1 DUF1345 domain-containing protein [Microbacteriaceae bacterium]
MVNLRYVSDTARANLSSLFSLLIGVGITLWVFAANGDLEGAEPLAWAINAYLFTWPVFGAIYLTWTHLAYAHRAPRTLASRARRENDLQARWWSSLIGYGGASSWTLTAALAAIFVTVVIAQNPAYRSEVVYVVLGLLCVASSWGLMVYSFALQYLRLEIRGRDSGIRHVEMGLEDDAQFGDYLTLTVLLSTMAATVSATIRSRQAWVLVRTNVLFAFTFNSVIVAMVVALLLGTLLA